MEYNILIETDFFNLLNAGHKNKGGNALENSYREFIKVVVDLCSTNVKQAVFALSYAETELDFHLSMPHIKDCLGTVGLYVRKAIAFVRRMQEHVAATYHLHVTTSTSEVSPTVSSESMPFVKWTGNAVDLVENGIWHLRNGKRERWRCEIQGLGASHVPVLRHQSQGLLSFLHRHQKTQKP